MLRALPEIPPYPQSQSHGYSFRREWNLRRNFAVTVAVKRSILIGSGIKTPVQPTLNVMGALGDLFDVSVDI